MDMNSKAVGLIHTTAEALKQSQKNLAKLALIFEAGGAKLKEYDPEKIKTVQWYFSDMVKSGEGLAVNATELWKAFGAWAGVVNVKNPFRSQREFGSYLTHGKQLEKRKRTGRFFYLGFCLDIENSCPGEAKQLDELGDIPPAYPKLKD